MNTLKFLQTILPEHGVHYLALFKNGQKFPAHIAFLSLEKMAAAIAKFDKNPELAVYHACASYKEPYFLEGTKKRYRKQPNWDRAKALWIDVDCGEAKAAEGKGYIDKLTAAKAIYGFCNKTSFPRPIVIDSGNGIHCYWPLTKSIRPPAWQTLATKLHDCFVHFGILVDPSRTTDFASVLRPVGSTNRKGTPRLVTMRAEVPPLTPEALRDYLLNVVTTYNVKGKETAAQPVSNINDDLVSTPPFMDSSAELVAERCMQVAKMRDTKGDVNYEHWRGVIGVIKHCTEGIKLARAWSEDREATGHAQNDVLTRYTTWEAGPTTCDFFDKHNPGGCDGCPHRGKIKSPIVLGRIEPESKITTVEAISDGVPISVQIPEFPKGYEWNNGAMIRYMPDKDGILHPRTFSHSLFYLIHRERKEDNAFAVGVRTHRPNKSTLDFSIDSRHIAAPQKLMEDLAGFGEIMVSNHKDASVHLTAYVRENLERLKNKANEINTLTSYGWKDQPDGTHAFLIGDRLYKADGTMTKVLVGGYAADFLNHFPPPHGKLADYAMAVNRVYGVAKMEPMQYAFCSGFGSILTPFSNESLYKGLLLAIYGGETAKGKTTVCYAALLAFGDAEKMMIQSNKGSTTNAQYAQMGAYGSIPMLYDEYGGIESDRFSEFAYSISSGQEKARMTSAGNKVRKAAQTEWRMSPYLTGNKDFHAILAQYNQNSQAEAVRLVQIAIDKYDIPEYPEGEVALWVRQMERNSGVAGAVFVQWVAAHQTEVVSRFAEWNAKIVPFIEGPKYRFYRAHATATLTAASIMQELGIIDFDLEQLFLFTMGLMRELCDSVMETNMLTVGDALNIMVNELLPSFLNTYEYRDVRTNPNGPETPARVYGTISGRYILGDSKGKDPFSGMLFVSRQKMKDWCTEHRVEMSKVIEHARQKGIYVADVPHFNLTRGTPLATTTLRCIQLDTNKMDKPVSDGLRIVATTPRAVDPPPQTIRGASPV